MRYKLFVYGTLKRGFVNHHYLKRARYLGQATTKERYPLVAPKIWYPYLIDAAGEGERIRGELYLIDLATLKRIDRLEEYPRYYDRKTIEVVDTKGRIHQALVYLLPPRIPYRKWKFLKEFAPEQE